MTLCPIFPEVCPGTFSDLSRTIFVISNCVTLIIETQTSLDRMHMTFGRARLEWTHPDRLRKSHSLLSSAKFMSPWQHDWYARCSCLSGNHSRTISPNFRLKFVKVTFLFGAGTRFSKVPRTFRARKAIRKTATCLFCKAGLFICCRGNKNKYNCKVSCLKTPSFWRYKENYVTRFTPEKFRDFRETGPWNGKPCWDNCFSFLLSKADLPFWLTIVRFRFVCYDDAACLLTQYLFDQIAKNVILVEHCL